MPSAHERIDAATAQQKRLEQEADRLQRLKVSLDADGINTVFIERAVLELRTQARKFKRKADQIFLDLFHGRISL